MAKGKNALSVVTAVLIVLGCSAVAPSRAETVEQAARRFVRAYTAYAPKANVEVQVLANGITAAGAYVALNTQRSSEASDRVKSTVGLLVDPVTRMAAVGLIYPLPATDSPVKLDKLPAFAEQDVSQFLSDNYYQRIRVRWPLSPARPAPVVALTATVSTGFGPQALPIALSADGKFLVVGSMWPLDRDPREVRRELLASAPVQWDLGPSDATVKIVEFSDFECPGCKQGWAVVKPAIEGNPQHVRHGLVNFPLVGIHPWAFRAAVAGACLWERWPDKLVGLKEEFYRLQDSMSAEAVDQVAYTYLAQQSLNELEFKVCFLKDPSIEGVLRQMETGVRVGVAVTPTYCASGEILTWNEPGWFAKRLAAIIAADGVPERAAEITLGPAEKKQEPAATPQPPAH
jgi:protein-disulfide isomerase